MYSFGVLMWEACCSTGAASSNNPLAGLEPTLAVDKVGVSFFGATACCVLADPSISLLLSFLLQILSGVRPAFSAQDHPAEIRALIEAAWHSDPAARPSAAALLASLSALC